jgi:hypothetical protein
MKVAQLVQEHTGTHRGPELEVPAAEEDGTQWVVELPGGNPEAEAADILEE